MAGLLQALQFHPVAGDPQAKLWSLQMPDGSVDAWIARHIELETSSPPPAGAAKALPELVAALSAREREVLVALADGLTNQQLADRLFISERTANRHVSNIFGKLGVRNRTAASRIAIESGLAG
jgi:DNA-binding NarL/FixJ family response regulator